MDAEVYYVPGEANLRGGPGAPDPVLIDTIEGGGATVTLSSQPGHLFRVKIEDTVDERRVPSGDTPAFFIVGVPESGVVRVACRLAGKGGEEGPPINIAVHPAWSPRGAARFLDLVTTGFFDGVALNRVVPRFLTQFGIGATRWETANPSHVPMRVSMPHAPPPSFHLIHTPNHPTLTPHPCTHAPTHPRDHATPRENQRKWRSASIEDDPSVGQPFKPGTLAYAGSGPNSRTTEMFVVMPGTPAGQLQHFGTNPWETVRRAPATHPSEPRVRRPPRPSLDGRAYWHPAPHVHLPTSLHVISSLLPSSRMLRASAYSGTSKCTGTCRRGARGQTPRRYTGRATATSRTSSQRSTTSRRAAWWSAGRVGRGGSWTGSRRTTTLSSEVAVA